MIAGNCVKLLFRQDCKLKNLGWSTLKLLFFISIAFFIAGLILSIGIREAIGMEIESDFGITEAEPVGTIQFKSAGGSAVVNIPDEDLEMAIRNELEKPTGDITVGDMETITGLFISVSSVEDLSGIEYARNLEMLFVDHSLVVELDPLSSLSSLKSLSLRNNQINCIEPLSSLVNLQDLTLSSNVICDIEPLVGLTQLDRLLLNGNNISDLEPLAGLFNLSYLLLGGNQISDLGPLAGLTGLTHLQFESNQVSNLAPLSNLTDLDYLQASFNEISDLDPLVGLTKIRILDLNYNKISDIGLLINVLNERLTNVGIAYNHIDISPGSEAMDIIDLLIDAGVVVLYEPQLETPLPGSDASLSELFISPGNLSPAFDQTVFNYNVYVQHNVELVNITPKLSDVNASLKINGEEATSGEIKEIYLGVAGTETAIIIVVTAADGETLKTYTITFKRAPETTFTDVTPDMQFYPYIEAIYEEGITTGYDDGTYRPDDPVTRGQMAAFLARALDLEDAGDPDAPSFTDVSPGMQFFGYIESIYAAGITTGYGDGTYGPDDPVTRGQMAAFLTRALDLPGAGDPNNPTFTDVSPDMQFFGHIEAIYAEGITTGYGDGTYGPDDTVNRGQMAAFLSRALGLHE